jgi:hypothetical protein
LGAEYRKAMRNIDNYVGEKTESYVTYLADKKLTMEECDQQAAVAAEEYIKYICTTGSAIGCKMVTMNRDMHVKNIRVAFDKISVECECDN